MDRRRCLMWSLVGPLLVVVAGLSAYASTERATDGTSIGVGPNPIVLAVDERRERAIVINNGDSTVSVLDTRTKTLVRTSAVGLNPRWVAVDTRTGHAFVVNQGDPNRPVAGSVSMLDTATGIVLHTAMVGLWPDAIAVDAPAARVFIANFGTSVLSVLDARTGTLLRTLSVPPRVGALVQVGVDTRRERLLVLSQTINRGSLTHRGHLLTFDAQSGRLIHDTPVDTDGATLFVDDVTGRTFISSIGLGGFARFVDVLDSWSGRLVRTIPLGRAGLTTLIIDIRTGRIFVFGYTAGRGTLTLLDARDGIPVRSRPFNERVTSTTVDARTGHVVVISRQAMHPDINRIDVFDGRTATVLRTLPAEASVDDLAVDGQAGRVIIVNRQGNMPQRAPWRLQWSISRLEGGRQQIANQRAVPGSVTIRDLS